MLKVQNNSVQQETFSALLSMGYKPERITLALEDSQDQSIEEVLDRLLSQENNEGRNPSKKEKRKISASQIVDEALNGNGNGKRKGSGKGKSKYDDKEFVSRKKDSFKEGEKEEKANGSENQVFAPKSIDGESSHFLSMVRSNLTKLNSKDPNEYVLILSDHLKALKFNTSELSQTIHKYLFSGVQYRQIVELRKKVHETLMKIMTMKRQGQVQIQELEYVLLMSFENRLLNPKQMDHIIETYISFCIKSSYSEDEVLLSSLERYSSDMKKTQAYPNAPVAIDMDSFLMTEIELMKCPNVTSVKHNVFEERKVNLPEPQIPNLEKKASDERKEKELCIICTEKTREIVLLPCCHFLTCTKCSPQVQKCPVCNKKVEKNLKIFWS